MSITETITNAAKAGKKSYLEVENGKLVSLNQDFNFFFFIHANLNSFFYVAALAKLQQERIEQRIKEEEQRKKDEEERIQREKEERQQREEEQRRREQEAAEELSRMISGEDNPDQTQIPSMGEEAEIETEEVPLSLETEQVECQVTSTETVSILFCVTFS